MIRAIFGFFAIIAGMFGVYFFYSFSASHNAEITDPMSAATFPVFGWLITLAVLITGIVTVIAGFRTMGRR